jgi:hypothetical protein
MKGGFACVSRENFFENFFIFPDQGREQDSGRLGNPRSVIQQQPNKYRSRCSCSGIVFCQLSL